MCKYIWHVYVQGLVPLLYSWTPEVTSLISPTQGGTCCSTCGQKPALSLWQFNSQLVTQFGKTPDTRKNFKNISKACHGGKVISRQWGWGDKHISFEQKNGHAEPDRSLSSLSPTSKSLRKSMYVVLLSLWHLPHLQHIVRLVYCCSYERKIQIYAPSAKSLLQILGNINIHTCTKQTRSRIPIKLTLSSGIWEYVN